MRQFIFGRLSLNYLLASLLVLAFSTSCFSQDDHQVRMAMIGNSITYGSGLPNPALDCYPTQLDTLLRAVYGDTVLIRNYGVSGRTMLRKTSNPIWKEPQFRNALEFVPDICLILLGTNDSQPERWNQWGDEFLDDYLAMIDTFKFRNPNTKFIVCYPPPIWEGHPYGTTFLDSHNDSVVVNHIIPLVDSVAKQTGAMVIDFHSPFVDSLQFFPDKLHPDVSGAGIMAQMLFDSLIQSDLVYDIDAGQAFVSVFRQSPSVVPNGNNVTLQWKTIFADSVFLDGLAVVANGNQQVVAETGKVYMLTAKGAGNTSEYPLILNTTPGTSIDDLLSDNRVKIFPNPVLDVLHIEVDNLPVETFDIGVFNSIGQQLLHQEYYLSTSGKSTIDLNTSALRPGVYFYTIQAGTARAVGKFTKGEE